MYYSGLGYLAVERALYACYFLLCQRTSLHKGLLYSYVLI